ncbi:hypothetical protein P4493_32685 [Bacillus thuringiensis]|uniref:DNA-binding protein n=4 Tax=Bacillus thuringiensis TaxID=1428 RepID=A0AAW9JTY7_BACTU|nr:MULTISPECIES: hypothetical protein [Bacillus]MED1157938.1 hypothetical protein [Bacillus paranthracis]AFQ30511.1 putative DNA-binding protein [Bacillus thuringiensis HD-789]AND28733.1 hypothetical protein ATN07_34040 [Bacillus thuringiensis serovar israelensis]ASO64488.1 putative DNA-binding protein [Bacillus thuringiensis serovar israelensis]EEM99027.1 hypothetical protein bthur0014_63630 [Bacillus thuringiensis IBL 4222]
MINNWMTIIEVEKVTEISYVIIRRYIRMHGHHLRVKKQGKNYLISKEYIHILLKIRLYYQEGKTTEQIEDVLCSVHILPKININENEKSMVLNVTETLIHMNSGLNDLNRKYDGLLHEFEKQKEYIEDVLTKRQQKLLLKFQETEGFNSRQDKKWWKLWRL